MPRTEWAELPNAVRAVVADRVGPVLAATPVADGLTCSMATVLTTPASRVFIKGVPTTDAHGVTAQGIEVRVNAAVNGVGPRLLARVTTAGWDLLAFQHVLGRHADLAPGSADLPAVTRALHRVQDLPAPAGVLPPLADRYRHVLHTDEIALLDGPALLHTDTNPHNILVTPDGAHLVDWAMAAAGPPWADVAFTAVRLMEADCPPGEVLDWAEQFPSWRAADPAAVTALVAAVCRDWEQRIGPTSARSSNARYEALLTRTAA